MLLTLDGDEIPSETILILDLTAPRDLHFLLLNGRHSLAGAIIFSFGLFHRASKSCLKWEDLTSFDLEFFCDDVEDISKSVNVTACPFTYNVQIHINFIRKQSPTGSSSSEGNPDNEGDDWKFWFGPSDNTPSESKKRSAPQTGDPWAKPATMLTLILKNGITNSNHSNLNSKAKHFNLYQVATILALLQTKPKNTPTKYLLTSEPLASSTVPKKTKSSITNHLIPMAQVFSRILNSCKGSQQQQDYLPTSTEARLHPTLTLHSSQPLSKPSSNKETFNENLCKRSARIRTKKIKLLGLVEDSLASADILFINSLTAAQISEMGKKCGLILDPSGQLNPCDKLKEMEIQRCGKPTGSVPGLVS
ncbi:hypothetical protein COCNU_03G011500 [Cocos nucifera]|uniref:Uncharacterized protein n=1 Tax=Cocos nucifera TaxID=13894 RepID=A0A8K0I470_COCNU|nr:hypothetical protein COCNU_03G011500 [Cocos nucifera]